MAAVRESRYKSFPANTNLYIVEAQDGAHR